MKKYFICFIFLLIKAYYISCDVKGLPRGVPLKLAAYYQERDKFQCDNNKEIPFEYVNDNYCDCDDGTDEPGTSACSNGFFYCQNVGFRPTSIPSSNVDDFVCDCCDGSDEWNSGIQCPNVCDEQGKKWREEIKNLQAIQNKGQAKRLELEKIGSKLFEEKQNELEKQKKQLEELEEVKTLLETKKNEIEEKERAAKDQHEQEYQVLREEHQRKHDQEFFDSLDINHDSKIDFMEFTEYTKSLGEATVDQIKEIFDDKTELTKEIFKDFSGKIRNFLKNLSSNNTTVTTEPSSVENIESEDVGQLPTKDEHDYPEEKEIEENSKSNESDELPRPPYNEETQKLIADANTARDEHVKVVNEYTNIQNNIKDNENLINFDYGSDFSWAAQRQQCAELKTTQYIYRLCLFDRTVQKDLNGHSEVILGYWNSWVGPENNKYSAQLYNKGQQCWNGPERSTYVQIECGAELELVKANEPLKCEYHFVLKSPSACNNLIESNINDEL